jgi:hypothetical protein
LASLDDTLSRVNRSVGVVGVMSGIGVLGSPIDRSTSISDSGLVSGRYLMSPRSSGEEQMAVLSVRSSSSVEDTAVDEVEESEGVRQWEILSGLEVVMGRAGCGPAKDIMVGIVEVESDSREGEGGRGVRC